MIVEPTFKPAVIVNVGNESGWISEVRHGASICGILSGNKADAEGNAARFCQLVKYCDGVDISKKRPLKDLIELGRQQADEIEQLRAKLHAES